MQGEASFVLFFVDFVKIFQSFPLFYRKPAKNSQQILVECVQKHFKSALEKLPNFAKTFISNNKMRKLGKKDWVSELESYFLMVFICFLRRKNKSRH